MRISDIRKAGDKPVEEPLLTRIYREMSYPFVKIFLDVNVSPNTISIINIFIAFFIPIFFLSNYYIAGIILLFIWRIFDCIDGEIARITNNFSRYGGFLDFIGEKILPPLLFIAIGINQGFLLISLLSAFFYVMAYYPIILGIYPMKNRYTYFAEGLFYPIYVSIAYFGLHLTRYSFVVFFVVMAILYVMIINFDICSYDKIMEGIKNVKKAIKRDN